MSITFVVDNVQPHTHSRRSDKHKENAKKGFFGEGLPSLKVKPGSIQASKFNAEDVYFGHPGVNNFVNTCLTAYNDHRSLVLSPDDVWVTILQAFSTHIQQNAEEVRKAVGITFEGKQKLIVVNDDFYFGSPDNNWDREFGKFSDLIADFLGKKRDFFDASFTTTGPIEKSAIQVQMMSALSSYFDYGMHTLCGLPSVTLLGEEKDWEDIFQRVKASAEFYPAWAREPLERVTSNFASSAHGKPPLDFWKNFVKVGGGSGGPYVSGHINAFFPYLTSYKGGFYQNKHVEGGSARMGGGPTPESYPASTVAVPMEWNCRGTIHQMKLLSGIVGHTTVVDEEIPQYSSYRPVIGWLVGESSEG